LYDKSYSKGRNKRHILVGDAMALPMMWRCELFQQKRRRKGGVVV
jgi:hypothetical protein